MNMSWHCCYLVQLGHVPLEIKSFLAVMLEFGVVCVFPVTCRGEHYICSLTLTFIQDVAALFGSRQVLCWPFLSCVGSVVEGF